MTTTERMTADEAAHALGVARPTLYAYVSRGLLHSASASGSRARRYRRAEVDRLARERERARKPALVAQASLDWGRPVLDSALTLIEGGRLFYRGQDAIELAREASLEEAAALLWDCDAATIAQAPAPRVAAAALKPLEGLAAEERCTAGFAWLAAAQGPPAADPIAECTRLLRLMTVVAGGRAASRAPVHEQLARAWRLDARGAALVRRALVLCADHELNASGFAARCVASTDAALGACVIAGLAALSGRRHCGVMAAIERLWDRPAGRRPPTADAAVPGQRVPGFGHLLYPDGDPRARALLDALPHRDRREALQAAVFARTGLHPSVDFALVALRRSLALPEGHAYLVFALGRSVGWLAHALEQQRSDTLIRPRAAYTGPRPVRPQSALEALPSRTIRRR